MGERKGTTAQMLAMADAGHPQAKELRAKAQDFRAKWRASRSRNASQAAETAMVDAFNVAHQLWTECQSEPPHD